MSRRSALLSIRSGFALVLKYLSFRGMKDEILRSRQNPRTTALSVMTGTAIAFCPFPGLHLITAFLLIKTFRLNGPVVIATSLIHNPWTMVFIHLTGYMAGDVLLTGGFTGLDVFHLFPWRDLSFAALVNKAFWQENGPFLIALIKPFILGSLLMSALTGLLSYRLTLSLLTRKPDVRGSSVTP